MQLYRCELWKVEEIYISYDINSVLIFPKTIQVRFTSSHVDFVVNVLYIV